METRKPGFEYQAGKKEEEKKPEDSIEQAIKEYVGDDENVSAETSEPTVVVSPELTEEGVQLEEKTTAESSVEEIDITEDMPPENLPISQESIDSISPSEFLKSGGVETTGEKKSEPEQGAENEPQAVADKHSASGEQTDKIMSSSITATISAEGRRFAQGFLKNARESFFGRFLDKIKLGKMQKGVESYETEMIALKSDIDALDYEIEQLDREKSKLEGIIEEMSTEKLADVSSFREKLRETENQKIAFKNEKDKLQSRFEAIKDECKNLVVERDQHAERIIERYNEFLQPMERELEKLDDARNEVDYKDKVTRTVTHAALKAKQDNTKKRKKYLEDMYRRNGHSEKEIREKVKKLEMEIIETDDKIKDQTFALIGERHALNKQITEAKKRANVWLDKIAMIDRVRKRRPQDIQVEKRVAEHVLSPEVVEARKKETTVESHTRVPKIEVSAERSATDVGAVEGSRKEAVLGEDGKMEIGGYLQKWNSFLKEKDKRVPDEHLVNKRDFFEQFGVVPSLRIGQKEFKEILVNYCKWKKIPAESVDEFFSKKINRG